MSDRLRIDNLDVVAGHRSLLRGVSLHVAPAEIVALMGPNGAGKSSVLHAVSGHLRRRHGTISVDGRDVGGFTARQWARTVAVVPQRYELPAGFTVAEIVAMGRHPHRGLFGAMTADDEVAIQGALQTLRIEHLSERAVHTLSGGEQQMVMLALTLAQQPRLLLLDEPTTHLDLAHEARIMQAVDAARVRDGLSALVVLHDLALAERYSDRMVLLRDGEIVARSGARERLPASVLAACFGVEPALFSGGGHGHTAGEGEA
jgi:iron complex transport system ATP-binding protein